jgi:glycosyltransferase involved in cell wall biosynthesis
MKIGFYIHHSTLQAGGIFTYSVGILKLLIKSKEIEKIVLILSSEQKEYFKFLAENDKIQIEIVDRSKVITKIRLALAYFLFDSYIIYKGYFTSPDKLAFLKKLSFTINPYKKIVKSQQFDLLHVPMQFSSIYRGGIPIVITMHDLQEFHYPEYFTPSERSHRAINSKKAIEESDGIIVSFNHIKSDIVKHFEVDEKKVSVCPPPFSDDWFSSNQFTSAEELKDKFNLEDKFLLYPAATWEHKNHLNLIKALSVLKEEGLKIQLVCTGNKTKFYKSIELEVQKIGLESQIKFLGIVPEEDLIGLYKSTSLVVIPTKYEAGSGPLYEAMRYAVPVICSNVTSLPDTIVDENFIFNPDDVTEIVNKIKRMLTDEKFKERNTENSVQRLKELNEMNYVDNFIKVYQNLIRKT